MKEENCIIDCDDEALRGEVFSLADIPTCWREGDFICELDFYEIIQILDNVADAVDEDVFDDGMPGMSGTYYKVYADNIEKFKREISKGLLSLLQKEYGKIE